MRNYLFSALVPVVAGACASAAQAAPAPSAGAGGKLAGESEITVTATGLPEPVPQTGQSISVLSADEIAAIQGADVTRLLERFPAVAISRNGGLGGFTSLRVRGASGEQLLVVIDGVRVDDAASPGGGYDLANLAAGSLARLELQRGSNSVIWGARALGGVLAAETAVAPNLSASIERGTYDTNYLTASGGLGNEREFINLSASRIDSAGFSTAASGSEPDGFEQKALRAATRFVVGGSLLLHANARYARSTLETDGFPAPAFIFADTPETQKSKELSGLLGFLYDEDGLLIDLVYSRYQIQRDSFSDAASTALTYRTKGVTQRFELRGEVDLAPAWLLRFGAEHQWRKYGVGPPRIAGRSRSDAAYAQLDYHAGPLSLAAGGRWERHNIFGQDWSLGADASFQLGGGWRARASYGEGFRPPSLFQQLSEYGNPALVPERARSVDAGIERGSREERTFLALSAFRRDTRDLIGFVSCFGTSAGICAGRPDGTYDNIGRARAQGLEVETAWRPAERLRLGALYALLEAEDRTPGSSSRGNDLARVPHHALTLSGDWQAGALGLGADLRVVSRNFEDAANTRRLGGYEVLTLRGSWDVSRAVSLFGRVENAADETYQTALGYATPGRSAYVGARGSF